MVERLHEVGEGGKAGGNLIFQEIWEWIAGLRELA